MNIFYRVLLFVGLIVLLCVGHTLRSKTEKPSEIRFGYVDVDEITYSFSTCCTYDHIAEVPVKKATIFHLEEPNKIFVVVESIPEGGSGWRKVTYYNCDQIEQGLHDDRPLTSRSATLRYDRTWKFSSTPLTSAEIDLAIRLADRAMLAQAEQIKIKIP